ncbi:MAG: trypsin-like peptidase domain-containing protein [Anaerolineales bacterium]
MKKSIRFFAVISVLVLAALACKTLQPDSALFMTATATVPSTVSSTPSTLLLENPSAAVNSATMVSEQDLLVSLYERVIPGIVSIEVATSNGGSQGTGFVYDKQGHIITNEHVVEGQTAMQVSFTSGFKAYAKLVGVDKDSDIAVIKVDAPESELFPLTLGDSYQLKVGQKVIAIGNPFGLSGTMTTGIVSALGRTLPSNRQTTGGSFFSAGDLIQTDAAINPGNSGGPLFNLNGEVIGINRAIRTVSSTASGEPVNSGIGFAISINIAKRAVPAIIKNGKYDYPYMGISSVDNLGIEEIKALGLSRFTGAYVTTVVPGGPADKAGIRAGTKDVGLGPNLLGGGDLIIGMDGVPIKNFDELLRYLINYKSPGDTLALTVLRDGQQLDISITLDKRP